MVLISLSRQFITPISLPRPLPLPLPRSRPRPSTSTSSCSCSWKRKMHKSITEASAVSNKVEDEDEDDSSDEQKQKQKQKLKPKPPWWWMSVWIQLKHCFQRHRLQWQQIQIPVPVPFCGWVRKPISASLLLLPAFLMLCTLLLLRCRRPVKLVPYSDLVTGIQLGHVSSVHFEEGSRRIYFRTTSHQHQDQDQEDHAFNTKTKTNTIRYLTRKMDRDEKFLLSLLRHHGVMYLSVPPPVSRLLLSCIGTIAGLWIGVIPLIWILERRLHGNTTNKHSSSATTQTVTFQDVQGVDSAKQELIELVNCLQGTLNYKKLGAKLPTGILLVGPPGTGKTLLARAVAGQAGVPFFSVSASEFVELYVGRGAARVRDLFKEARRQAPAVVFIDELDAVGTERDGFSAERDQTLNQLLTEMDGFNSDEQVIVLAATNRPSALDPALLRPGRFSRKVLVGEPNLEGRKRILAVHLKGVLLEEEMEVICDLVASLTEGFVGADLANIANEAALLAVRRGGGLVTREDIMEAVEREKFGITENKAKGVKGSKGLVKLLQWLPSLTQGSLENKNREGNAIGSRRVLSF